MSGALEQTFFGRLPGDDRARLAALRGAVLMYAREPGDRVMILLAGRVKVARVSTEGHETLLAIGVPR